MSNSPIDFDVLADILGTDDKQYLNEMLRFMWDSVAETPSQLTSLVAARDAAALKDAAHAAKGAVASAGAETLSAVLQDLEFAAGAAEWDRIDALFPEVKSAFSELEQLISNLQAA